MAFVSLGDESCAPMRADVLLSSGNHSRPLTPRKKNTSSMIQDDHHHQLEREGAALLELLDHKAVEIVGGLELLVHQSFVIEHADFAGRQAVQACGEHIAHNLMALSARSADSVTSSARVWRRRASPASRKPATNLVFSSRARYTSRNSRVSTSS